MELDLFALLQNEIRPALGCTEPAAVALACAMAASQLSEPIERIIVHTDPNVFKNGMGVYIPGTEHTGLFWAAALGALNRKPELELEVLSECEEHLSAAQHMLENQQIVVLPQRQKGTLSILAQVISKNHHATALIEGSHTHLKRLTIDDTVIFEDDDQQTSKQPAPVDKLMQYSVRELLTACTKLPDAAYDFVLSCAQANHAVAQSGLAQPLGLGLGWHYQQLVETGKLNADLDNLAMIATAAAADARMSGCDAPIFSTNGSGNQGITASLPVLVVGQNLAKSDRQIGIALAISQVITIYVKQRIGKLSALCACAVAAAVGASCGIAYLLEAPYTAMEQAIQLMVANLTGMICDGTKVSCSLKLATAAGSAVRTAMLAKLGLTTPEGDGIIAATVEETLCNLGTVSNPGMVETIASSLMS